jgi:hypothetical protein
VGIRELMAAGAAAGMAMLMGRFVDEDPRTLWRLSRLPVVRVGEAREGPARVRGRVLAVDAPLVAPISGRACVYYHVDLRVIWKRSPDDPAGDRVRSIQTFEVDDGTGRLLVPMPPPRVSWQYDAEAPYVYASLEDDYGVDASSGSQLEALARQAHVQVPDDVWGNGFAGSEAAIATGDVVEVGGALVREVAVGGGAAPYRASPERLVMRGNPLLLVTRRRDQAP